MKALVKGNVSIRNVDGSESYLSAGEEVEVLALIPDQFGNEVAIISNDFCLGVAVYSVCLDYIGLH